MHYGSTQEVGREQPHASEGDALETTHGRSSDHAEEGEECMEEDMGRVGTSDEEIGDEEDDDGDADDAGSPGTTAGYTWPAPRCCQHARGPARVVVMWLAR